jgi:hypothetical protein
VTRLAFWATLASVVLATAALSLSILLRAGDASIWARSALALAGVVILVVPPLWGRSIWPDVAVLLVVLIAVYAGYKHDHPDAKEPPKPAAVVAFEMQKAKVRTGAGVEPGDKAVVLLVTPKTVTDGKIVAYASHRYTGTRTSCASRRAVCFSLERGTADADIVAFSADLRSARTIYLLPVVP